MRNAEQSQITKRIGRFFSRGFGTFGEQFPHSRSQIVRNGRRGHVNRIFSEIIECVLVAVPGIFERGARETGRNCNFTRFRDRQEFTIAKRDAEVVVFRIGGKRRIVTFFFFVSVIDCNHQSAERHANAKPYTHTDPGYFLSVGRCYVRRCHLTRKLVYALYIRIEERNHLIDDARFCAAAAEVHRNIVRCIDRFCRACTCITPGNIFGITRARLDCVGDPFDEIKRAFPPIPYALALSGNHAPCIFTNVAIR